jgi:DNA modification methylase
MGKETASLEPVQQNTLVPLTQLYGHSRNYRQHPPEQIKKLKSSLERFGFVRSLVAQVNQDGTYTIVAGHGIVQAAQELVDSHASYYERFGKLRTDVIPASWSPEQVSGYLLADNTLSSEAVDDEQLLAELLQEQQDAGYDLASVGSDDETLRQMLQELGDEMLAGEREDGDGGDEFDVTPEEGPTRTHVGEMWQLGEHRLLVGDSTSRERINMLMQNEQTAICFTSPPYNAGDSERLSNNSHTQDTKYVVGGDDAMTSSDYFTLLCDFTNIALSCCEYVFVNIQILAGNKLAVLEYLHRYKNHFADIAVWCKSNAQPAMARRVMTSSFEAIVILSSKEYPTRAIGTNDFRGDVSNVYSSSIQGDNKFSSIHAATFPLHLPSWFIENFTNANDLVFEPFGGTGTTLIACERLNRKCRVVELVPMYADVILRRYEAETGQTATLLERQEVAHA